MPQDLVVCEHCNAVHHWRPLASAEVARCSRCAAVLGRGHRLDVHALLALAIAAAVVLLIANTTTVIDLRLRGAHASITLPEAIHITWQQNEHLVAVAAAVTAIVAPALLIGLRLLVLWPLATRQPSAHFVWAMRVLHEASRWSMVEVMTVSGAIAIVRMAKLAHAMPGPGMLAFGALALLLAALESGGLKHLWMERP
ncbi:MAG TPA: paraquat-inducible protein A [Albitalea sp.]|nr:paraquat-inducible protein A [Albitalea sp.]